MNYKIDQKLTPHEIITIRATASDFNLLENFIDCVKINYNRRISISAAIRLSLQMTKGMKPTPEAIETLLLTDRRRKKSSNDCFSPKIGGIRSESL